MPTGRPFQEFRDSGLLWLVNRVVFHPRGYALAWHYDDAGTVTGWSLLGDGSVPWSMGDPPTEQQRSAGALTENELFTLAQHTLAPHEEVS